MDRRNTELLQALLQLNRSAATVVTVYPAHLVSVADASRRVVFCCRRKA